MNDREEEFRRAMASLLAQEGVNLDIVVVGNGVEPQLVPPGIRKVALPDNVGIPGGRNIGAANVQGDLLLSFDNDAILPTPDTTIRLAACLQQDPDLAYMQPRITDPDTGITLRRWVPRLRTDAARPSTVTVMAEGITLMRREAFERVSGWPGHFFLFHEGIDLAWRCWDHGYTGYYMPNVIVHHPTTNPQRHAM